MSYQPIKCLAFIATSAILLGCSASHDEAPTHQKLRPGPALTDAALSGMYMDRNSEDPESAKFVACLDDFLLRFDQDEEVSTIFTEISEETDTPLQEGNIAYFTDQTTSERYKRLVDQMIKIDTQTEGDLFNFDSSSTCVLSPEDCTLPAQDANIVRLYWTTIEHGSMGCFE